MKLYILIGFTVGRQEHCIQKPLQAFEDETGIYIDLDYDNFDYDDLGYDDTRYPGEDIVWPNYEIDELTKAEIARYGLDKVKNQRDMGKFHSDDRIVFLGFKILPDGHEELAGSDPYP